MELNSEVKLKPETYNNIVNTFDRNILQTDSNPANSLDSFTNNMSRYTFNDHVIVDKDEALNLFRSVLIACFKQDSDELESLSEKYKDDYRDCFNVLAEGNLLRSVDSTDKTNDENNFSIHFSREITTLLTNKGMRFYNNICNDGIWETAVNAFKKNDADLNIWAIEKLCSYL